ncbi:MAG: ABC transporter ATP-binding protein [Eubacteriales bacterium]|nr:ABC transporter ATP-binding protein [Eubacteriales bacterium]
MENVIEVTDVTKVYRLYDKPIDRLRESLSLSKKSYHRDFYALSGVSFSVEKGQSVGIIGTNGSGKSTMLKIITGVLTQTAGSVRVNGTISALLELGAGFNMDYTGIENIYMNGTMMGFSKKEMDEKLPDILEFADIGDFVHQPVKSYSSGMFVRLAFALAINVEPEILIVDEALSVGDVFFQAKCYHRMDELRARGTTILMVTHDMGSVMKYCDKVVLLNKGEKIAEGVPGEMVDLYKKILAGQYDQLQEALSETIDKQKEKAEENSALYRETSARKVSAAAEAAQTGPMRAQMTVNPNVNEYGNGKAEIYDFGILDEKGKLTNLVLKGENFSIRERIRFHAHIDSPIFTFTIRDKRGNDLTGTNTMFEGVDTGCVEDGDGYEVTFSQHMNLQGGEYLVSMSCTGFEQGEHTVYHRLYDLLNLTVISNKNTVGVYDMESGVNCRRLSKAEAGGQE